MNHANRTLYHHHHQKWARTRWQTNCDQIYGRRLGRWRKLTEDDGGRRAAVSCVVVIVAVSHRVRHRREVKDTLVLFAVVRLTRSLYRVVQAES